MTDVISIIFTTYNQVLKLESSPPYQYLSIFLLKRHNWISLLLQYDRIEEEIDRKKTENCFICTYLGSKSI